MVPLGDFTVDPPPKDSDLPPLEGLGLDSKFRSKNFSKKLNESDHFLCISLHLYLHYPQGLGFKSTKGLSKERDIKK